MYAVHVDVYNFVPAAVSATSEPVPLAADEYVRAFAAEVQSSFSCWHGSHRLRRSRRQAR